MGIHWHHTTSWCSSVLKGQHKNLKLWGRDTGAKHGWKNPDMPLQKRQGVWSPFYHQCEEYLHRVRGLSQPASAANLIASPESFAVATVSRVRDVEGLARARATYRCESAVCSYPISRATLVSLSVMRTREGGGVRREGAHLIFASACAGPDEGVRAEVTLDIGGDDFASDAFTGDEPLVHARRHGEQDTKVCGWEKEREGTDVSVSGGPSKAGARSGQRGAPGSK